MPSGRVFWRIWMIRELEMGAREGNRWLREERAGDVVLGY
jgi:hypothetical protein